MSENVYYRANANKVPELEEPLPGPELDQHHYNKFKQPQGVYNTVRVAEQKVGCQQKCY